VLGPVYSDTRSKFSSELLAVRHRDAQIVTLTAILVAMIIFSRYPCKSLAANSVRTGRGALSQSCAADTG
jgi:hypothetical protein